MNRTEPRTITGERIRELIKRKEMTEAAFAYSIHVKPAALSAWITGSRKPSASSLVLLAENLNTTVDYLTGRSGSETSWKEFDTPEILQPIHVDLALIRYITLIGYDPFSTDEETLIALTENLKQYINGQCEQVLKKSARPAAKKRKHRRYQTSENKEKEGK